MYIYIFFISVVCTKKKKKKKSEGSDVPNVMLIQKANIKLQHGPSTNANVGISILC
jgi:hypothetical protein